MFSRFASQFVSGYAAKVAAFSATAAIAGVALVSAQSKTASMDGANHGGLNPKEFVDLKVKDVITYNHNTKIIDFELESPTATPNLPITSYVVTRAEGLGPEGKPLMRPYTPIHSDRPGVLSLLVKEYATGTMSKYLCSVKPGDKVGIKGPLPKFKYVANDYKAVTLIAGGSGITPVLQLLKAIVDNKDDKTKVDLVFANVSQADILLKEDLDDIAAKHKDQVKVTYVIDKPEAGFKGPTGFLTKDLLSTIIAKPAPQTKVFVCGPPGFMKAVSGSKAPDYSQGEIDGALKELGFDKDGVFKF